MNTLSRFIAILSLAALVPTTGWTQQPFTRTMKQLQDATDLHGFVVSAEVVSDTITTLMWQRTDGGEMTYASAVAYCDTLTLGGFSDWRLPSSHELFSINDLALKNPAIPAVFTATAAEYWWSVDTLVADRSRVWCTNAGGGIGPHPITETISAGGTKRFHVRAVRSQQPAQTLPSHFTDLGTDIVRDEATGLMWQQYCLPETRTWQQALAAADTLSLGSFTDWRLPNIKELQSLRENLAKDPCVDLNYFPCVTSSKQLWSATPMLGQTADQAWIMQPALGIVTYDKKTQAFNVLCVRGGRTSPTSVDGEQMNTNTDVVYPNPTFGLVHLPPTVVHVDVVSVSGTLMLAADVLFTVNVEAVPNGMYILVLRHADGHPSTKLIVKQ